MGGEDARQSLEVSLFLNRYTGQSFCGQMCISSHSLLAMVQLGLSLC